MLNLQEITDVLHSLRYSMLTRGSALGLLLGGIIGISERWHASRESVPFLGLSKAVGVRGIIVAWARLLDLCGGV